MSTWSVYISPEEERLLKKKVEEIAEKNRWSFSQAVAGILKEHLIDEKNRLSEEEGWALFAAREFFAGYSEKDSAYDDL